MVIVPVIASITVDIHSDSILASHYEILRQFYLEALYCIDATWHVDLCV